MKAGRQYQLAPRPERGIALIEALVAFAVLAAGLVGLMHWQTLLWRSTDVARQQTQALALAQTQLSPWLHPTSTPANISSGSTSLGNAVYAITPTVVDSEGLHRLRLQVNWQDSSGTAHTVALNAGSAGDHPMLSAAAALLNTPKSPLAPRARALNIPATASDLSDGRSAWRVNGGAVVWVFDNLSGVLTSRCLLPSNGGGAPLTVNDLQSCRAMQALVVSGLVAFAGVGIPIDAAEALHPSGSPKALHMALQAASAEAGSSAAPALPTFECIDNSPSLPGTQSGFVAYWCAVDLSASEWSAQLTAVPQPWSDRSGAWAWGHGAGDFRLCRYSADQNQNGSIEPSEHPLNYRHIQTALLQQNFLVIPGSAACPIDTAADPAQGHNVNVNTVETAPSALESQP